MYFSFRKPEPPPEPIYKRKPIATAAVILTVIGMFILGPIGAIYTGLSEELKEKANNETVLLYMKQQKETDDRQWQAIEKKLEAPKQLVIKNESEVKKKSALTPEQFEKYTMMAPDVQVKYKKYLESMGYNTEGL
jgi:hypothetical protein